MDQKFKTCTIGLLVVAGVTLAVYLGMRFVLPVILPFLLALFLLMLLNPLLDKLHKKLKLNRGLAASILLGTALLVLILLFLLLLRQLFTQAANLISNLDTYRIQLEMLIENACNFIESSFGIESDATEMFIFEKMDDMTKALQDDFIPGLLSNGMAYMKFFASVFTAGFVMFISVIMMAKDYKSLKEKNNAYLFSRSLKTVFSHLMAAGGTYLKAQLIIIGIIACLNVAVLLLLKNPYAFILGIIIGLFDALPLFGTGIILIPWAVFYLFQGNTLGAAALFLLYGACAFVREYMEPKLIGNKLGIQPVFVLMSIYIGIKVYGLSGLFLGPVSFLLISELVKLLFARLHITLFAEQ